MELIKIKENERQVRLCNFVDVYHNWAITQDLYKDFMIASANEREIDLFKIKKGQVAITKDSETRDDIGISTYIADDFQDVILGYHTALITPNEKLLNGKFLNAFLHTSTAKKHFENNASGSGQRYTLTNDSISSIKVPLYDIKTQEKIGNLFTLIDKKIFNNNKTNKILENLAKTIYDYWFVQYEFPNKEGKPYKSSGGEMTYSKELKREIPKDWGISKFLNIARWISNSQPPKSEFIYTQREGYVRFIQNRDFENDNHITYVPYKKSLCTVDNFDILIDKYGDAGMTRYGIKGVFNVALGKIDVNDKKFLEYVRSFLSSNSIYEYLHNSCMASTRASLSEENLASLYISIPQSEIVEKFENIVHKLRTKILFVKEENRKLKDMSNFLLPLLMNGQVTIKEAEEKVDQSIKEENITIFPNYDLRFELWLQNQGLAARGDIDRKTLREIFDAMDDNDK